MFLVWGIGSGILGMLLLFIFGIVLEYFWWIVLGMVLYGIIKASR